MRLLLTLVAWRAPVNRAASFIAHLFNVPALGTVFALSACAASTAILPTGIGVLLGLAVLASVTVTTRNGGVRRVFERLWEGWPRRAATRAAVS